VGLLDKTNAAATRKSLICWAIGTAIFTVGFVALRIAWVGVPVRYWPAILIAAAVFGGCIGFLMEWQIDDGTHEGKSPVTLRSAGLWDDDLDQGSPPTRRAL
jgi:hypothetical protein